MSPSHGPAGAPPTLAKSFPPSGDLLLEVRDLGKRFPVRAGLLGRTTGWLRAVDGIDFWLRPGETLGLVGESGSGKSTAGRAVLRLLEPTSGSVVFQGDDVLAMDREALRRYRRDAQIVFQDPYGSLDPRMTAAAVLDEVLGVHGLAGDAGGRRRRVRELLSRVGLGPEHEDRYPHEFSGGQRQRLGIARALSVEPRFIVLDEPVSALDVSVRAQVVNLLVDLQRELGLAYLFIAHDLALVEHVSDRVMVMYLGRIVEVAPAARLYRDPRHPYTRALLSAVPRTGPRAARGRPRIVLSGDLPSPVDIPPGCPFHPRCPHPARDLECTRLLPPLEAKGENHFAACIKEPAGASTRG